jgi:hypothetical protein
MRARTRTAAVTAIAATVIITGSVPASAARISAQDITFSPAEHAIVRGTVTVTASNVADDVVRIALTDQVITAATAAPWELSWDTVTHQTC